MILPDTSATVAQVEMSASLRNPDTIKINVWVGFSADSKLVRFSRLDNFAAKPSSGSNKQAGMIVAYLKSFSAAPEPSGNIPALGNEARGKQIFEGKGNCQSCHRAGH